jgi:diaminopimelate epimerase
MSPVQVDMTGGRLLIEWDPGEPIRMRGSATHVFSGELDLEALN